MSDWETLQLNMSVLRGIHLCGFEKPSPIQEKAIPSILEGRDVVAQAQSGTGKQEPFVFLYYSDARKRKNIRP